MPVADAAGVAAGARLTLSVFDGPCAMGSQSRRPAVLSARLHLTRCQTLAKADPLLNCLAKETVKAEVLHRLWIWTIQEVVGGR